MTKIKKLPKDFIVCDGMTQDLDIVSHLFILLIILIGIPVIVHFYLKWLDIKEKIKKNENN